VFSLFSDLGFREKNPKRGDFEGLGMTAGESLRLRLGLSVEGRCGGEMAESIRGDSFREEDLEENPNRDLTLDVGVSWDEFRL
jgi:hypothetical protein